MSAERGGVIDASKVKYIYYDVGGVILNFEGGFKYLSQISGLPESRCKEIWASLDNPICRGITDPQEIWKEIKKESGCPESLDLVDCWVGHFSPNLEVHDLVKKSSKKYKIGLLTNIYPKVFAEAMVKGMIPRILFDNLILSSSFTDVAPIKPEVLIYDIAEMSTDFRGPEILFVDDLQANIQVANKCGWQGFLFDKNDPAKSAKELSEMLI